MTAAPLWTAADAAAATGGRSSAGWAAQGVSIDSRSIKPGDLFVALAGPHFDGHDFVRQAIEKGAVAALVHRPASELGLEGLSRPAPLLLVEDTARALDDLGRAARARSRARIVGLTGSVGKTSTKEALARVLGAQGETTASAGSLNNHWGLPLSLARMPETARYGVFELGMNHKGEIAQLTAMLRPHIALITNIAPAHLGNFPSLMAIARAKAEIFLGLEPDGTAVLSPDGRWYQLLSRAAREAGAVRIVTFGRQGNADVRLLRAFLLADGSQVTARVAGQRIEFTIALPGSHWVMNALAVLAVVHALDGDTWAAAGEFARLKAIPGRGQQLRVALPGGAFMIIDDSYNANPTSMRAAFEVLGHSRPESGGRRVAVLGDMLELGADSARLHAELAEPLEGANIDRVHTCGDEMQALHRALKPAQRGIHAADSEALALLMSDELRSGDVVLVKGSAGSRMGRLVAALKGLAATRSAAASGMGGGRTRSHAL